MIEDIYSTLQKEIKVKFQIHNLICYIFNNSKNKWKGKIPMTL